MSDRSHADVPSWSSTPLSRFLTLAVTAVNVEPDRTYPIVGVLNRGRGLLHREPIVGDSTSYGTLNKIEPSVLIYSRLKAFEGALTVTPDGLPESYASQEFPTFTFTPDGDARFFRILATSKLMWNALQGASKGMGGRRERVKPDDFLNLVLPIPPLGVQRRIAELIGAVDRHIDALVAEVVRLGAILDFLRSDLPDVDSRPIFDVLTSIDSGKSVQAGGEATAADKYRILKLSAVQRGWFRASEAKSLSDDSAFSPAHVVRDGDLLITRANTPERVGFASIARRVPEGTFMPDLIWRLRVKEEHVSTSYLEHALSSTAMRALVSSAAGGTSRSMVKLNKRNLSSIRVPVPPLSAQIEYVKKCGAVAGVIESSHYEVERLRAVRTRTLSGLLDRTIDIESAESKV